MDSNIKNNTGLKNNKLKGSPAARSRSTRSGNKTGKREPTNKPVGAGLAKTIDTDVYALIQTVRDGVPYGIFQEWANAMPFSPAEWSTYLHLSERTMQRYRKEEAAFDAPQSEKILEIRLLFYRGAAVFEDAANFATWLDAANVALGHVKPKDLLDSSFGINLLQDELTRIEHGVLA